MPTSLRQTIAVVAGALAAFTGYKLLYAIFSFIPGDVLRNIISGVLGVILGIGTMYLVSRGKED